MERIIRVGGEFDLDWNVDRLLGWEQDQSDLVIAAMIKGIEIGCEFPSVDVVGSKSAKGDYELACGPVCGGDYWEYGGHHRAVAHYIKRVSLKCKLLSDHRTTLPSSIKYSYVDEFVLCSKNFFKKRLVNSLGFLPRDVAEDFCVENGLNIEDYLLSQSSQ
jgi:hypothetical protein